jgi:predicted MFS family arabinose efflux permease
LIERAGPAVLGRDFRWLWAQSRSHWQRSVPAAFLGRVTSVYMLGSIGGSALGVVIGGLPAQRFGLTAPFWFAFLGSAILLVLIWRTLAVIAHARMAGEGLGASVPEGPIAG